jgi:hypothetical protein
MGSIAEDFVKDKKRDHSPNPPQGGSGSGGSFSGFFNK